MKIFAPFLLVPLMGVAGWQLSALHAPPAPPALPAIAALDAPPALGVAVPDTQSREPVRVNMRALLPPTKPERAQPPVAAPTSAPPPPPEVTAILIHGQRRVAQVAGTALSVGEGVAGYRVSAIEAERVLFENTSLGQQRWVPVTTR